jgi:Cu2+-exporting ATPase
LENNDENKGHSHGSNHNHHIKEFRKRFWISLLLTIPVLLLSETIQGWFNFILQMPYQKETIFFFASVIYFYGGWPFLKGLFKEIGNREPGMMTLIGFAISVAFFYSTSAVFLLEGETFFWGLATLIDVMLLGHWVEAKSVMGASRALEELVKIMPTKAHLIKDGEITDIPIEKLKKGNIVIVKPGEKIPSDGEVVDGESYVNESLVTGESKPVHKKQGDKLIGGSINEEGSLRMKIEKTGEETFLSRVIKMVKDAQESKSKTQNLADRAAALLFYVALGVGIVTFIVWVTISSTHFALSRTVTVLVIACPHALGLAIPLVVAISTSLSAKNGILIRNRMSFENARSINAVMFDKTGTLTEGKFRVTDLTSTIDDKEFLRMASAVEQNSEHIIARSIVDYAKENDVQIPDSKDFKAIPGKGAKAIVEGKEIYIGSRNLMEELGINFEESVYENIETKGKTVVYAVFNGKITGAFALSDTIKDDAYQAVAELKDMGIEVFMLTGDSQEVAEWVSEELGIDEYFAEVLPDEKVEKVKYLKGKGYRVAMVGDGINDAPALANADVGIAIGAGTDVAIESGDIVLVKSRPSDVSRIIDFSRKTFSKMIQNLWWAAGYNIVAIPLAAGVLYSIGF